MSGKFIGARIEGLESVNRRLAKLSKPAAISKAMRSGVTQGAKLLSKGMKGRTHKGKGKLGGLLRKSIGQKVKTYRSSGVTVAIVGPRKGFLHVMSDGRRVDPVKYGHIEEFGRRAVRVKKAGVLSDGSQVYGTHVAQYAGHPFVRPTLDADGSRAETAIAVGTMKAVEKELAKK